VPFYKPLPFIVYILILAGILLNCGCTSESSNSLNMDFDRDECKDSPDCVSVTSRNPLQISNSSQGELITLRCPDDRPYYWDWGYESSRGLEFTLRSIRSHYENEKSDEVDIEVSKTDDSTTDPQYNVYCACSSVSRSIDANSHGDSSTQAPVVYAEVERFPLQDADILSEDYDRFSYVGNSVINTLYENDSPNHTYLGITWNYSTENLFKDDFILQTPDVWGVSVNEKYWEEKDPCAFNRQMACNDPFKLPECNLDRDCNCSGIVCKAVEATVTDAKRPQARKLCMRPQDILWNEVYKVMVAASKMVDITTLNEESQAPDGRFRSAVRNAVTYLATTGREVTVRILIGHLTLGRMKGDPAAILEDILRDVRDGNDKTRLKIPQCRLRVQVGYYEASNSISFLPWYWGDTINSLLHMSMNHSKIVCADGALALIGGQNMFDDDYLSRHPARDITLRVEGPAAYDAHAFASHLWRWIKQSMPDDHQDHIYAWTWEYGKPGEYQKKKADALNVAQLDSASYRTGKGSTPVISVGKLGYWYFDKSELPNANASELAIQEMFKSAKKTIMISQQDAIWGYAAALERYWEPPYTSYPYSWYPMPYMETIIDKMVSNKDLHVYVVVSNLWARTGEGTTESGIYYNGLHISEVAKMFENILDLKHPEVFNNTQARLDILCKRLHVAPLRFGPDENWDQKYLTYWGNEYRLGFANHAKTIIIDDQAFYVGSHNFYPMNLQEYGLIVDDKRLTAQYISEYWGPLWKWSQKSAVCGGDQPCMFN
jgi:phosphatidylserine/phosphatidylglycerophosphate/cardiolipin synthase-like enzyme